MSYTQPLFPADLPTGQWSQFRAAGFNAPAAGFIYTSDSPPSCGMPLGGIDTGSVDLEADGTLGFCTLFNSHVPRRGPLNEPFLGLHVDGRAWVLATPPLKPTTVEGGTSGVPLPGVNVADRIDYWGHYPVADLAYHTAAPVQVSLRAWSPFLPGDLEASTLPGAVFEVHLVNTSDAPHSGTLLFTFPGPTEAEAGTLPMRRRHIPANQGLVGVEVAGEKSSYVLGVIANKEAGAEDTGNRSVRFGGALGHDSGAWLRADKGLPYAGAQPGASAAVTFSLLPGASQVVRFVLTWHSPQWYAGGTPDPMSRFTLRWYERELKEGAAQDGRGSAYTHMYAARFGNAVEVARLLAKDHAALLARIVAWQSVIYNEADLPVWLRDSLVNILHLINETGFWAMAKPPIGAWCQPELGLWGMNEDPRNCPQIECVPCSFYGNYPVVLFFPRLALSTLHGYKAYQFENGEVTWIFGGMTDRPPSPPIEMATPTRGYQTTLNGPCVVDMVYRYWLRTCNRADLDALYDMVKRSTIFTMNLRPEDGPDGIISFPTGNVGLEWFEACTWAGMAAHAGGIHLANLKQAAALAEVVGDHAFAQQCHTWFEQGSSAMEHKMWAGDYYLNYYEPATGNKSDLIMANQLDGEWMVRLANLPSVFQPERIRTALDTVKRTAIAATPYGAVNFTDRTGRPTTSGEGNPGWNYNPHCFFPPEVLMLGETYMYEGERDYGMELCRRCWDNIARNGLMWDQPNIIRGDTGERVYGGDYYQNMLLWTVPAAYAGQDFGGFCAPGGLVDRVIQAAR